MATRSLLFAVCVLVLCPTAAQTALGSEAVASVSAEVVSPVSVAADIAAEVLMSSSVGVLTFSIPGATSASAGAGSTVVELLQTSAVQSGAAAVFTVADAAALEAMVEQMALTGGTLTTSGFLSGKSVQVVVTQATAGSDGAGLVTAIVTYN